MVLRTKKVTITFPIDLLKKIDSARGDISRSRYMKKLIENEVEELVVGGNYMFSKKGARR